MDSCGSSGHQFYCLSFWQLNVLLPLPSLKQTVLLYFFNNRVRHLNRKNLEPLEGRESDCYLGKGVFGTCIKQDYRGVKVAVKHYSNKVSLTSVEREASMLADLDHPGN